MPLLISRSEGAHADGGSHWLKVKIEVTEKPRSQRLPRLRWLPLLLRLGDFRSRNGPGRVRRPGRERCPGQPGRAPRDGGSADTEIRRDIREVQVDQAVLRDRQEELGNFLLAAPAATPADAAASARYLIQLSAATPEARAPRPKKPPTRALDDLSLFAG